MLCFIPSRPILYSIAGLGIAIVNDFKSVEGDRQLGLNSLPVAFGIDGAFNRRDVHAAEIPAANGISNA